METETKIRENQWPVDRKREVFQKGRGVYTCVSCGKRTRGDAESADFDLCGRCNAVALLENSCSDGIISESEFSEEMQKIEQRYGRE